MNILRWMLPDIAADGDPTRRGRPLALNATEVIDDTFDRSCDG